MPDMLVKLYDLPALEPLLDKQREHGITIRRGINIEKNHVVNWIRERFSENWTSGAEVAFSTQPTTIMLAYKDNKILGFACYDIDYKGFFGPTGVEESERGAGIGTALLLMCLHEMRHAGYLYGIIGWAGPVSFYEKAVGATVIEGTESTPPPSYRGILGRNG